IPLAVSFAPDGKTLASGGIDGTILVWDASGRGMEDYPRSSSFGVREAEAAWADLASLESPRAVRALWALVAAPIHALAMLRKRLHPVPVIEAQKAAQLVADLGNGQFAVRNAATVELRSIGEAARPALTHALAGQPPLEIKRRIEQLLGQLEGPERL